MLLMSGLPLIMDALFRLFGGLNQPVDASVRGVKDVPILAPAWVSVEYL